MSVGKVYAKTMGFVWMKLGLGAITVVLSSIWLAILVGIGLLYPNVIFAFILSIIWIGGVTAINGLINHYFGYLVKAGHVAIIANAVTTGQIPDNQFETAKTMVQERFITSNVYFVIDKLVASSVSQIQRVLQKADHLLGDIPGVSTIVDILELFVKIALNYVDECCLGYTFIHKEDSAFKSAADGVVIYVQNWKSLLKSAAMTTFVVIGLTFVAWILPFVILGAIFTALSWSRWIAFVIALMIAISVKYAFIDSYMMVKMMVSYMQVAPSTVITYDLYGKLCGWSDKFKELFGKAKEEGATFINNNRATQPQGQQMAYAGAQNQYNANQYNTNQYDANQYSANQYNMNQRSSGQGIFSKLQSLGSKDLFGFNQNQGSGSQYGQNQYGGSQGQSQYVNYGGQQGQPQNGAYGSQQGNPQYGTYQSQQMQPQNGTYGSQQGNSQYGTYQSQQGQPQNGTYGSQQGNPQYGTYQSQQMQPQNGAYGSQQGNPQYGTYQGQQMQTYFTSNEGNNRIQY